jgi:hypothetical protein
MKGRTNVEEVKDSNPIMMFVITALALVGIGVMASQTWLFIDFLMPHDAIVLKVLTLSMFDIAALAWTIINVFYDPPTRGFDLAVKSGMTIDFILATITTVFYCVIAYVLRFSVHFDLAGLAILMEVAVTFATVFNCVLWTYCGHGVMREIFPRKVHKWDKAKVGTSTVYSLAQTSNKPFIPAQGNKNRDKIASPPRNKIEIEEVSTIETEPIEGDETEEGEGNKKKVRDLPPLARRELLAGKRRARKSD